MFDVRAAICESCGYLATHSDASPEVAYIVAMLFRARKDRNTMVRTKAMDTLRTLPVSVLESCKVRLEILSGLLWLLIECTSCFIEPIG